MKSAKCLVTGGAGFIGSNLVDRLVQAGNQVTIFDNFSLGRKEFIAAGLQSGATLTTGDLLNLDAVTEAVSGQECVFHMAANSDIDFGRRQTDHDLQQGTLATYNVLEAMRRTGVRKIVFASSSAIYGETRGEPIPEDYGPLLPISFYGASKLACEGLISAFCHNYGYQAWIFRFANIVGRNATHGALFDFVNKLRANPQHLDILGDGRQSKPYLLVDECVDGMLHGLESAGQPLSVFNLACDGGTEVRSMAEIVAQEMGLNGVEFRFSQERRGWIGDVPFVRMDPSRLARLGWRAKYSSDEAVRLAARDLVRQPARQ